MQYAHGAPASAARNQPNGGAGRPWWSLLPVPGEEAADADDSGVEVVGAREGEDAEVVRARPVEPRSLHDLDFLAQQQVEDELFVVLDLVHGRVQAREGVEGTLRLDARDARDLVEALPGPVTLFMQPPAGQYQVGDALPPTERGLDGVLAGNVGAQPRSGEGGQT